MMKSVMPGKIFYPLIFLLRIIESSELFDDSNLKNFIINNPPATHYYPEIFLKLNESDYKYTEEDKIMFKRVFNHTKSCEQYGNYLVDGKLMFIIDYEFVDNSSAFFDSIVKLNDKFISIMTQKIIHGNYSGNANDDIYSTLKLMNNLNKYVNSRSSTKDSKLLKLLQHMIDFYYENKSILLPKSNQKSLIYQKMYTVYNCVSLCFLNSYAILFNSYNFLKSNDTDFYQEKIDEMRMQMREKLLNLTKRSQKIIKNTSIIIRQNDPKKYEEGNNYGQLKRFLHAHVITKQILHNSNTCGFKSCSNSLFTTLSDDSPHKLQCNGNLHDCWTTSVRQICFSANNTDTRAYQAFKNLDNVVAGPWNTEICQGENLLDLTPLVKEKKPRWGTHILNYSVKFEDDCEVCTCYCDDYRNTESIRKFSLQQVRSRFTQGIVTGVRMQIEDGIVVLKIQVGLLVNGVVKDISYQSWNSSYVLTLNPDDSPVNENSKETEKIPTVKLHYNYRNVLLDHIYAPQGWLIQGVKFVACQNGLSISVLATKIDERRNLLLETATWFSNCQVKFSERTKIEIPENPDIPTKSKSRNFVISKANSYVQFQTTDWTADGSQTTVPFLDTRKVIVDPPLPISGVGFYYRSHERSGGFIGLQLSTLDHSYFLSSEIINKDLDKFE